MIKRAEMQPKGIE